MGNFLRLSGGAVVAQGLAVAGAPIISRLFAPDAFGLAAVFASVLALLVPIGCLRFELPVMLPREDEEAASIVALGLASLLGMTGLVCLGIAVAGGELFAVIGAEELKPYRWLLPPALLLGAIQLPLASWHSRNRRFGYLARVNAASQVGILVVTIGAGVLGFVAGGHLVAARLAGQMVHSGLLLSIFLQFDARFTWVHTTREKMLQAASRYRNFPLYSTWIALMNTGSLAVPPIIIASYFGPASAGLYALARRIVLLPMQLVSAAASNVLFQRASELRAGGGNLSPLFTALIRRLLLVATLPAVVLIALGEPLFALAFGGRWLEAGSFAAALAPWMLTAFVVGPVAPLFNVLELQRLALVMNLLASAARVGALVFGGEVLEDPLGALYLYAAAGVAFNASTLVILGRKVGVRWPAVLRGAVNCGIAGGAAGLVLHWVAERPGGPAVALLLGGLVVAVGAYAGIVWALDPGLREFVVETLRNRIPRRRS